VPVREWITPFTNPFGIRRTFRIQNPGKDFWFIALPPDQGRLAYPNGNPIEGKIRIPQREAVAFDVIVLPR
jgi:hypothetical protein